MQDTPRGSRIVRALLILIIVAGLGFIVWELWPSKAANTNDNSVAACPAIARTNGSQAFQLPSGWDWYENKDIGLKFAYPAGWGAPTNQTDSGKEKYLASFTEGSSGANTKVTLSADCSDFQSALSDINGGRFDSSTDQSTTKAIAHSQMAYSALSHWKSDAGNQYELMTNNLVNVGRIRSVLVDYSLISGAGTCPDDALAPSAQPNCINRSISDQIDKIISSLQQI